QLFEFVQDFYEMADPYLQKALKELTPIEKEILSKFAFTSFMESEDSLKYQNLFEKLALSWRDPDNEVDNLIELQAIIAKVNFQSLMEAGYIIHLCGELIKDNYNSLEFTKAKPISIETEWGWMAFGSEKDDNYKGSYCFIFEPDGNDTYRNITSPANPFQIIIDGKGDDYYKGTEVASLFGAQFSVVIGYDLQGDDTYLGDDFSFAAFFGYQFFEDSQGSDLYRGEVYSIAAASYGISIIRDRNGDDRYSTAMYGEAFGGTLGIGALMDMGGDDSYLAGGKHLHKPLAPFDYLCMAQGFGFGVRPDYAGGIGLLYDRDGNDSYQGGVYSQAGGYWYALGLLLDEKGNDFYNSVYYPQGTGIHLAAGFLWDGEGEDSYYSKHGPGQGAGHDYGVGFLVDRGGDDHYSIEGGNGLGLTNSVGIFLDVSGNDRYERENKQSFGYANTARSTGGIGIFLDLQGEDIYNTETCGNDTSWVNGHWGIGLDTLFTVIEKKDVEKLAEETVAEVDSLASVEELFAIACEWEVGSAEERVKNARKYLLKQEVEASKYIAETAMDSKSSLTKRAIYDFAKNSDLFKLTFDMGFEHEDSLVVKNYIALTANLADSTHVGRLKQFLAEEKYVSNVLAALGSFKTDESLEIISEYVDSPSEKLRFTVASILKSFKTDEADAVLFTMRYDDSFLVRSLVRIYQETKLQEQE
ncbi:MAG: HEAT repeat domain-containing protein, partial [Candidatus Zophobacter franzmannii]|nr:HEAT repeat domain-containing protein [Candidatus Zophobacter franzmannii]